MSELHSNINFGKIKNIIFDLGGVIMDIDINSAFAKLAAISGMDLQDIRNMFFNNTQWQLHEIGKLTDSELINYINTTLHIHIKEAEFYQIWNSILKHIPGERIDLINKLSKKYQIYILSNTNKAHIDHIDTYMNTHFGMKHLSMLVTKAYYSYEIGKRKPNIDIYDYVLADAQLAPHETVFIDDSLENVLSAQKSGIITIHLTPPATINTLLQHA
ncbi:MAG: HAD family phosphatase [Cytophagales bacterium]|nr:HAD family phosphatase [Cytophagales bacterium]